MSEIESELTTIRDLIRWTTTQLRSNDCFQGHGTTSSIAEACHLVLAALNLNPNEDITLFMDATITTLERQKILRLVDQRVNNRIPTAYLTHTTWLSDLPFYVDERVIIPRSPLVELINAEFQPWLPECHEPDRILDMCTGSGCLAILASYVYPDTPIDAVDISADAIEVANINIQNHGLEEGVTAIQSDLFSELGDKRYSIIMCNPPYVSAEEYDSLPEEYSHEPENALKGGGDDGLDIVAQILRQAHDYLTDDGILVMEVGYSADDLEERYPNVPFTWVELEQGGQGVFVFTSEQLDQHQAAFAELVH